MPSYDCDLCNFSTKLKTDFRRHLKTKKHIKKLNELKTFEELHIEKNLPAAQFCSKNVKKNLNSAHFCSNLDDLSEKKLIFQPNTKKIQKPIFQIQKMN